MWIKIITERVPIVIQPALAITVASLKAAQYEKRLLRRRHLTSGLSSTTTCLGRMLFFLDPNCQTMRLP